MPRLAPILLAIVLTAAATIAAVSAGLIPLPSTPTPTPTLPIPDRTLAILLIAPPGSFGIDGSGVDAACRLEPPWTDLAVGAPVTVTDENGTPLGRSAISRITVSGSWNPATAECHIVVEVPVAEAPVYLIDISGIRSYPVANRDASGIILLKTS